MNGRVRLEDLTKRFGTTEAVKSVNLEIPSGSFFSILGPSGCGKTTLLRIISGLLSPTVGSVSVNGKKVDGPSKDIGIVFQNPVLLEWRNILDNILLPIEIRNYDKKQYLGLAKELLKLTGLSGFEKRMPYELSGGMKQRACICRALIENPSLLLMDEPFGALDAFTRDQMNIELLKILAGESKSVMREDKKKKTVIFITHSITEAVFLSDKVVVLSGRPSMVLKSYDIPFDRPRNEEVLRESEFGNLVYQITEDIKIACGESLYA